MNAGDVDLIVTLSLLGLVLFVAWPAAVLYARRCNRESEQRRSELDALTREWIAKSASGGGGETP